MAMEKSSRARTAPYVLVRPAASRAIDMEKFRTPT
jgi:hypothetical protein